MDNRAVTARASVHMIGFVILNNDGTKKGGQVTKPITVVKIPCKLFYSILRGRTSKGKSVLYLP